MASMHWIADIVAVIHFAIIVVDVLGAITVARGWSLDGPRQSWKRIYLAITISKSVAVITHSACPLTKLENWLRQCSDSTYLPMTSFVTGYMPWLPTEMDQIITCLLMLAGTVAVVRWSVADHAAGKRTQAT